MIPISVCIIAKNASRLLPNCFKGLSDLTTDIIVVVDSSSTDSTFDVASKLGARVFTRKLDNFASQKNYAASLAKNDWVFFIDTDEVVSQKLLSELKHLEIDKYLAYRLPRLNYIFGKPIYHTNWSPSDDTHIWLYNKKFASWQGDVHEEVMTQKPVGSLTNYKHHYSNQNVTDFFNKLNLYTSLETHFTNPFFDFFRRYIWHYGFLDGWHGLFLSYLMFIYHTVTWVKLWQKHHVSG